MFQGSYVAIKCMKSHFKSIEQVNSLREIQALRRLNPHPNISDLEEVLYDKQVSLEIHSMDGVISLQHMKGSQGSHGFIPPTPRISHFMVFMSQTSYMTYSWLLCQTSVLFPSHFLIYFYIFSSIDWSSCSSI